MVVVVWRGFFPLKPRYDLARARHEVRDSGAHQHVKGMQAAKLSNLGFPIKCGRYVCGVGGMQLPVQRNWGIVTLFDRTREEEAFNSPAYLSRGSKALYTKERSAVSALHDGEDLNCVPVGISCPMQSYCICP